MLTPEQIACFKTFGFLFFRQAFSTEEMESLIQAAEDVWTQELGRPPEVEEDVHTVPFVEKHPRLMSLVDDDRDDSRPTVTDQQSVAREAVSAVFAQYEHDRQAFGTGANSRTSDNAEDLSLEEYLKQDGIERIAELFSEQDDK